MREMGGELVAAGGRTFDGDVVQRIEKIGKVGLGEFEDVSGEAAGAGGGFDEQEFGGAIELTPHFSELAGEETSEDGMDVHAGVIVAEAANLGLRIVAMDRVIEALAHIFGEGDGAEAANAFGKKGGERCHAEAAPVEFSFCRVCQVDWKMSRERASKRTKWMVSSEVSPFRCWRASVSMIFAHSSMGKPETPVPIAGKAMDLRLRSAARRREWAVEVRRVLAVVRMPPRLMLAAWMMWRALSPATPAPRMRSLLAALTMASTSISVRSPCWIWMRSVSAVIGIV